MAKIDHVELRKIILTRPDLFEIATPSQYFHDGDLYVIKFVKYKVPHGGDFNKVLNEPFIRVFQDKFRYYSGFYNILDESFEKIFNMVDEEYKEFFIYHLDIFTEELGFKPK